MEKATEVGIVLAIILVTLFCLAGFTTCLMAKGEVEFCYIQAFSRENIPKTYYNLYGFRNWRENNTIGIFESFDDAVKAAEQMKCPLRK
jgi:hypothetical protein